MTKRLIGVLLALSMGVSGAGIQSEAHALAASPTPAFEGSPAQAAVSGAAVVGYAERFLGYPYTTVGNSPSTGFSCIGFVSYVYRSLGVNLPGDLGGAMAFAPSVPFSALQPGDVLYFANTVWPGLSHAAIYIGGGRMIHAEWYNRGVVISSLTGDPVDGDYWTQHYLGANRPWALAAAPALPVYRPPARPAALAAPRRRAAGAVVRQAAVTPIRRVQPALPAGPRATVLVPALNVRTAPSTRGRILTALSHGALVAVLGHAGGWYRVALRGGTVGWAVGAGIGLGGTIPSSTGGRRTLYTVRPRATAPRRSLVRRQTRASTIGTVSAAVGGLRVHASPSIAASVLGSVGSGQRMGLIAQLGQWDHVVLGNGITGWVSNLYLRSGAYHLSPRIASHPARATASAPTRRVSTAINVRVQPSAVSPLAGLLVPGRSYRRLGTSNGWVHVRVSSGITGWVLGALLPGGSASISTASSGVARQSVSRSIARRSGSSAGASLTAAVRVHTAPDVTSRAIAVAYMGTPVHVLGTGSTWDEVRLPGGRIGYVLRSYVRQ